MLHIYKYITSNMQLKTFIPFNGMKLSTFDKDSYNIDARIFFKLDLKTNSI